MSGPEAGGPGIRAPAALAPIIEDHALCSVLDALNTEGEETRIVGGALRNALLGRPVEELDLATTLLPETVMARATGAGLRAVPTGIAHGTVTVVAGKRPFEITTLREDIATDGRHATVRFGRDFRADALRRDFTINALSMTRDGRLFDYVGGLADIAARRVRFIGEPARRIAEDYLRILRFFRFSAEFGEGALDAEGRLAAIRQREGLSRLSKERIRAEILKLVCTRRAAEVCSEMAADGLLHPLIACVPYPARLKRLAAIAHASSHDPALRLAALSMRIPEDAERLREALRLSNAESERLEEAGRALIALNGRNEPPKPDELRILLFRHGRQAAADALILVQAEARPGHDEEWERARSFVNEAEEPRLPFSGADMIARGISQGPAIGETLRKLEACWIRAGFPKDPASLARLLDEAVPKPGKDARGA